MVYGRLDDSDCKPLSFIEAAKIAGIAPDVMRRYLDRADVRALLLRERRAFRVALCAGNEGALARVRDKSENSMAVVASVRALEQLDVEGEARSAGGAPAIGVTIQIVSPQEAAPAAIDARGLGVPYKVLPEPEPPRREPIFKPRDRE